MREWRNLVDALDLGSSGETLGGSSPPSRTIFSRSKGPSPTSRGPPPKDLHGRDWLRFERSTAMRDRECLELGLPWLGRGVKPYTAGFGKRRGATSWENLRIASGVRELPNYGVRTDGLTFHGPGLMGGYPYATGYKFWLLGTNVQEIVKERKPYPLGEKDLTNSPVGALLSGTAVRSDRAQTLGKMLMLRVPREGASEGPGPTKPI